LTVQTGSHAGNLPDRKSFFKVSGGNAVITALKPKSGGNEAFTGNTPTDVKNGVILRLYETHGETTKLTVKSDFKIDKAEKVNLVERNPEKLSASSNSLQIDAGANSIETVLISYKKKSTLNPSGEGNISLKKGAGIYAQYWQHNTGAAPTGYLPVTVKLSGNLKSFTESKLRLSVQQVEVAVCNNYIDKSVSGKLKIETPPGLRAVPSEIDYSVEANSEKFYPVAIVLDGSGSEPGFIKASIEYEEDNVFDVLEYNMPEKLFGHLSNGNTAKLGLEWEIIREDDNVEVIIKNPFAQKISGNISIIGPVESWGTNHSNPIGLNSITPWRQNFDISANGSASLKFNLLNESKLSDDDLSTWLVAKLSYYGYVDYKKVIGDLEIVD
jgi:hypothetical protein